MIVNKKETRKPSNYKLTYNTPRVNFFFSLVQQIELLCKIGTKKHSFGDFRPKPQTNRRLFHLNDDSGTTMVAGLIKKDVPCRNIFCRRCTLL
jgi:hypothetical protein